MKMTKHEWSLLKRPISARQASFFTLLLLFMTTEASRAQQALPEGVQNLFVQGVEALKTGQLDTAEGLFSQVLRQGGRLPFVYNNLGIVYQQRGEHVQAASQFREALRLQPDYAAPRILLGISLLALGRIPEAIRELERAIKLQPREPLARLPLAKAYERGQDFFGAAEQYRVIRELVPKDPEYAYQLYKAYVRLSVWSFEQMKRLNPRSARVYQTLGENYYLQGQLDSAVQAYRNASQADPKLPGIHFALAEILLDQGKKSDALGEIDQELILVPESKTALEVKQKIEGPGHQKH